MHKFLATSQALRTAQTIRSFACKTLTVGAALILAACGGSGSGGDSSPAPSSYAIAGSISGLGATGLVLQNNGGDNLTVAANTSSFQFATPVAAGGNYSVTIATQPAGLTCTVSHGIGTNVRAVVTTVSIACSPVTHTISGTITGLTTAGLVLRNNGADDLTIAANATSFQFASPVAAGSGYSVIAFAQPTGLTCSVSNGVGTNVQAAIGNIQITCSATALSIGGTVTGLTGSGLVLQNNGGDDLSVAANASSFEFATPVAYGGGYAVAVLTQPAGQTCSLVHASGTATTSVTDVALTCANIPTYTVTPSSGGNGSISPSTAVVVNTGASQGFVATPDSSYGVDQWLVDGAVVQSGGSVFTLANITANHTVAVTFGQSTLSLSVSSLALSVTGGGALTGEPRVITVTNTGSLDAQNFAVNYPTWPSGTTAGSSCGSTLAAGLSCGITITPSSNATSGCEAGTAPTPGVVSVTADNANTNQVDVVILAYGCIYQGGYLFAVDDTTPITGSIAGKIVAQTDNSTGIAWDNGGSLDTGAGSLTDGATNTINIVSNQSFGAYAAQLCADYEIDSLGNTPCLTGSTCYSDWYLPAICEMGYDEQNQGSGCGTGASPTRQNIQSNLVDSGPLGSLLGSYWSSTQNIGAPTNEAWLQVFITPGSMSTNAIDIKAATYGVRCARALTP